MTTREANSIKNHINKAVEIFFSSDRFYCSKFCDKCDFKLGDGCFMLNEMHNIYKHLKKIKKSVIPNETKRKPYPADLPYPPADEKEVPNVKTKRK